VAEYRVAIHESAHAVAASVFDVSWVAVSVSERDGHLGRLTPNREFIDLLLYDPDGTWPAEAFAMCCLAGPLGEAAYMGEKLDWAEHIDFGEYGAEHDFATARMLAEEFGVRFEGLLEDTARFLQVDKIWLAVNRTADRLIEETILPFGAVDRIIGIERS
jgi:hypothetical protein